MVSLKLGRTIVERNGNKVYIIAEIGQNHQGNLEVAKQMILEAKVSSLIFNIKSILIKNSIY